MNSNCPRTIAYTSLEKGYIFLFILTHEVPWYNPHSVDLVYYRLDIFEGSDLRLRLFKGTLYGCLLYSLITFQTGAIMAFQVSIHADQRCLEIVLHKVFRLLTTKLRPFMHLYPVFIFFLSLYFSLQVIQVAAYEIIMI